MKTPGIRNLPAGQQRLKAETIEVAPRRAPNEKDFKRMIRQMNLKVTAQRLTILQALHSGRRHTTAQEVFELVNADFPEIGFATVYRFLKSLTQQGFVSEVRVGGLPARYEVAGKERRHHDHMTCTVCGRISEFENEEIEQLQNRVAQQLGFELTGHVLELYGVCPSCTRAQHRSQTQPQNS